MPETTDSIDITCQELEQAHGPDCDCLIACVLVLCEAGDAWEYAREVAAKLRQDLLEDLEGTFPPLPRRP